MDKIKGTKPDIIIIDEFATQLPVFVYGTLRKGFSNYNRILKGKTVREIPATLHEAEIYFAYGKNGFPAVIPGDGIVIGELMHIDGERYDETVRALDWLEGFNRERPQHSMYVRTKVEVMAGDKIVKAITYIWNRGDLGNRIITGDWAATQRPMEDF